MDGFYFFLSGGGREAPLDPFRTRQEVNINSYIYINEKTKIIPTTFISSKQYTQRDTYSPVLFRYQF